MPTTAFRPGGPLPTGVTLLEASAGTGKTHAIAGLVVRYVADGVPLDRILVVTFTKLAAGELRERVRGRLLEAARALAEADAGVAVPTADEALAAILTGTPDELRLRAERLDHALGDFDAATITTIHSFCHQALDSLGAIGAGVRGAELMEDAGELRAQVVDDLFVRRFGALPEPPFPRAAGMALATVATANPEAAIVPQGLDEHDPAAQRAAFATAARAEVVRRTRRLRIVTHDDVLMHMRDSLLHPEHGAATRTRLRERYTVALVDEFQDTDPVQWQILSTAFAAQTLILIGDPKQAIYSFRGADLQTYLAAARSAGDRATLAVNWRSDQALLDALAAVFGDTALGDEAIRVPPVRAARDADARGLAGAPDDAPLRLRVLRRADGHVARTPKGWANAAAAAAHVAADVADEAVRLLASGATVSGATITPGDLAVLVRTNPQAVDVRNQLEAVGVPAVIGGSGSVFETPAATDWIALLRALERPGAPTLANAAALTCFIGWDAARVAAADDAETDGLHTRLHTLRDTLTDHGVATLLERIAAEDRLAARLLERAGGERMLTDIRHVAQLLHRAGRDGHLGVAALIAWLSERIAEASREGHEDRSRRIESDVHAVQVLTIHRAKGLEFPVVFCPFLWGAPRMRQDAPRVLHDPGMGGARIVDVGGKTAPGAEERMAQYRAEQWGEELRLAYVALTRARHQAVVWWAATWDAKDSALRKLLFPEAPTRRGDQPAPPDDDTAWAMLEDLGRRAPVSVSATGVDGAHWTARTAATGHLEVSPWRRALDRTWRRTSYSAIIAPVKDPPVGSEPEHGVRADEPPAFADGDPRPPATGIAASPLPLAGAPGGVGFGSLVHAVFERIDFTAPDLAAVLADEIAMEAPRWKVTIADPAAVAAGLVAAIETPLIEGVCLRGLASADRLDELAFELPLAGGEEPAGTLRAADIADLLERMLPPTDPFAEYAGRLRDPALTSVLRGHLTGSLDVVARLPDGRFAVVDYKTNQLGPAPAAYAPDALALEMRAADYPLQALLYLAVLHRLLRWRLPGYDPDIHLAGAGYLFLRGMAGPAVPSHDGVRQGVFWWRPPPDLVASLSDLLDRGPA